MEKFCILSDFDGTITVKDSLYTFFKEFASPDWMEVERLWVENKINSKECLIREFGLVPDLTPQKIQNYLKTIQIDSYFQKFYKFTAEKDIDVYVVSDGVDYFINTILDNHGIAGLKVISNHGQFENGKFCLSFPNDSEKCVLGAGTCKCNVLKKMKAKFNKIIYIGDGTSDFCVANKADILYAKSSLADYCKDENIDFIPFNTYDDILKALKAMLN